MSCIALCSWLLISAYYRGVSYSNNDCDFVIFTSLLAFCLIGDIYDLERFKEAFIGIFSLSSFLISFLL